MIKDFYKKSVYYRPNELEWWCKFREKDFLGNKNYPHMYLEDIEAHLFPFNQSFVELLTPSEESEKIITSILYSPSHNLSNAYRNFIENSHIIYYLLLYGECHFEIIRQPKSEIYFETDSDIGFEPETQISLEVIPPYSAIKILDNVYQYLPQSIRKKDPMSLGINRIKDLPPIIKIDGCDTFSIKLSSELKNQSRGLLKKLAFYSDHSIMPAYAQRKLMEDGVREEFDYQWYKDASFEYIAAATSKIGWNVRNHYKEATLEFYEVYRLLKFQIYLLNLRTCILEGINQGLNKVIQDCKLKYINMPTETLLGQLKNNLFSGEIEFKKIYNAYIFQSDQ